MAPKSEKPKRPRRESAGPAGAARGRPALTSRAAILALVVCVIALSLAYPLREYIAQRAEITELREENARTKENVAELDRRHDELQQRPYIEQEARTRLHYQYPDEKAYVVVGDEDEDTGVKRAPKSADPWFTQLWKSVQEADQAEPKSEKIPEAQPPSQ
ncbi:cell division protein FtsB [Murinocardiopsis flavida]|uniref:Cell division protein FtsB n=1 Tax=Murinocardiopsis flavida TaxID=645275 RepID=A0A2P8DMA0_9ACTN|nr:septum formation initiator family protein [Murinocardiopsis flavida]PSK98343.1 cell division protein FtsB [Murinocardiopsis flavida]